ncbi:hypothetical protein GH714_017938 [Hevea brasiliensis]|uniref:Cytochrome P450 n=1 Tax=Hevea brasiliensis TaxID=3981 RepID=A0A6A6K5E1_HEVBR|nr:hypothetical protein GH714_017938 [Hevea brasiliensis]
MGEMLNQPEILAKTIEELDRVVGKDRLVVPHVAMEDTVIGDYFIPKSSWAILSPNGLGRNPKTRPDPLKYDAERLLIEGEVVLTERDLRFVTFSTGRRGCVAALLGSAMITMLLARMLQCFTWTPPANVTKIDLTETLDELTPTTPISAFATPRLATHLYPLHLEREG